MTHITFKALIPSQSDAATVVCFVATAKDIARIARIERLKGDEDGVATGFQRPQIANHIREISDYLERPDAILANPIVLGFVNNTTLSQSENGYAELTIDISTGSPGWIVDGQQRFSALIEIDRCDFEVPVSAFICRTEEELRRQFILINNTKPLPKGLIYELLPNVEGLPKRFEARREASRLTSILDQRKGSSLKGMINRQLNPQGVIKDTILQRVIMNSLSNGALQLYRDDREALESAGVTLVSEFFHAVKHVYRDAWDGHTAKTSRLIHGVGMTSMGFVMEYIHASTGATKREQFIGLLTALRPSTAWTDGEWQLGNEKRRWNGLQDVSSDWKLLSFYLLRELKQAHTTMSTAIQF